VPRRVLANPGPGRPLHDAEACDGTPPPVDPCQGQRGATCL